MHFRESRESTPFLVSGLLLAAVVSVQAATQPAGSALHELQMEHPALRLHQPYVAAADLATSDPAVQEDLAEVGATLAGAYLDPMRESWGTLIVRRALIPGSGVGNSLSWADLGMPSPRTATELAGAAERRFFNYLQRHARALRIDPTELVRPLDVVIHRDGALIQIRGTRTVLGLPVRDSGLVAVVSHGNLVLLGTRNWGTVRGPLEPRISPEAAMAQVVDYLSGWIVSEEASDPQLVIVPTAGGSDGGGGYRHRLAWVLRPVIDMDIGRWEAVVDARDGELLSFRDLNVYDATRKVSGGVYPVANDGIPPDGIEQPGWPMPFADVSTEIGMLTADSSGHLPIAVDGLISTDLSGPFVSITEDCGEILESSPGDLDLGAGPGTNCDVPPGASPGNTHAARTTFYELNRIIEVARGQLPANSWLRFPLTAETNAPFSCGALWNGTQITLGTGGFGCASTGELAGVIDHEWGHGMDDNDANGFLTAPAEGMADVYSALRLNTSCIGRSFFEFGCNGYGDPCLTCTGVRDIDWAQHASGEPHDLDWVNSFCSSGGFGTPCGRLDHCESAVFSEAIWDLYTRTLASPPFVLDANTALEITTRLTYLGAGAVDNWYTCDTVLGTGNGCNADGGYLNFLTADDDNGDLGDGTPHMQAIFNAFDLHGIACPSPAVQNGGCLGGPSEPPFVSATALDRTVDLSWEAVPGASKYEIFRAEGVHECAFSKVRVGKTTDTSFVDTEVRNDFEYFYTVAAVGPTDSCLGPMSDCTPVTPAEALGPEIAVVGSCPGQIGVTVSRATPGARVALVASPTPGSFSLPGGVCAGTELDLGQPIPLTSGIADAQGSIRFPVTVPLAACGALLQALDLGACTTSPAVGLP